MKLLAIGDFHGRLSPKFKKRINKEKIDLIISIGDYAPFKYRKLWFKHCYGKDIELWEVIGKKKYRKLMNDDIKQAEKVLKRLNDLNIPVYTVLGNVDWPSADDIVDEDKKTKKSMPNWDSKKNLAMKIKKYKNFKRLDYRILKFKNLIFIGMRGHSVPGKVKSKAFRKHRKILEKLFNKYKKENREGRVIFVSHNIAYNTKLDKISAEASKRISKNLKKKKKKVSRHYGSKLARGIINKYHPLLHIGGHIHEAYGKDKLGRTILINPGEGSEGKFAIIDLDENKGKVKSVRLIK